MMKNFLLLFFIPTAVYAQQTFTLTAGKKEVNPSISFTYVAPTPPVQMGAKLYYPYYQTDNKTKVYAKIDVNSWELEEENIPADKIYSGSEITSDLYTVLKNNTVVLYNSSFEKIAEYNVPLADKYSISNFSFAFNEDRTKVTYCLFITQSGGTGRMINLLSYDVESNEFSSSEITDKESAIVTSFLSREMVDDKVIVSLTGQKASYAILDLNTGKFQGISFDHDVSYFSYSILSMAGSNYFIFHSGVSTSKSTYYHYETIFKVNMETGRATFLAEMANTNGSGSIWDSYAGQRQNCGFLQYGTDKFVVFGARKKKVSALFIEGEETKYIEIDGHDVSPLYNIYFDWRQPEVTLITGWRNEVNYYTLDLENKTLELAKTEKGDDVPAGHSRLGYGFKTYNDGKKDIQIDYYTEKDKKTGTITFIKNKQ